MPKSSSLRPSALSRFLRFHVSKVWLSHLRARGASHGAVSGTAFDMRFSWRIAFFASTSASALTGGTAPVYSPRRPLKKSTLLPTL